MQLEQLMESPQIPGAKNKTRAEKMKTPVEITPRDGAKERKTRNTPMAACKKVKKAAPLPKRDGAKNKKLPVVMRVTRRISKQKKKRYV